MTDTAATPDPTTTQSRDHALASSVPDDNHILMKMIKLLLGLGGNPLIRLFATSFTGLIMLVYVIAKWGVPAILALQTLILQLHGDNLKLETADREIQRQQADATQAVLAGVNKIDKKVSDIGLRVEAQGRNIDALSTDVTALKRDQATAGRRLDAVSSQQQALQKRLADQSNRR